MVGMVVSSVSDACVRNDYRQVLANATVDRVSRATTLGSVRWLDDDEMRAWRGLVEVFADLNAVVDAQLTGAHGITGGDYGVLVALSEAPARSMRMCDLAGHLHLSPSGLTRRLDGLVRDGIVARKPAPDDRRVTLAVLTPKGLRLLERAAPGHVETVRRHLLRHLTRDQIRELGAAMDAVRAGECAAAGASRA
jgi:DNA-binding MarR family transcriptional regulator